MLDGDAFDAGALGGDGFGPAEVGVGWRHIAQAFVVAVMIIVRNERLDLALGLRMIRCSAHMFHSAIVEPFGQVAGYVAGAIVAEQSPLVPDVGLWWTWAWSHPDAASAMSSVSVTSSARIVEHNFQAMM